MSINNSNRTPIAVLCSAGGGCFFRAFDILCKFNLHHEIVFHVVSELDCAALDTANLRGFKNYKLDKSDLKSALMEYLDINKISTLVLLTTSIIPSQILKKVECFNIHPSVLPAFKGLHAINKTVDAQPKVFGATTHRATEVPDSGPIVGQIVTSFNEFASNEELERISHIHKVYCFLQTLYVNELFFVNDKTNIGSPKNFLANPMIKHNGINNEIDLLLEGAMEDL